MQAAAGVPAEGKGFKRTLLLAHTATHFAVDFVCYYFLMSTEWRHSFLYVALIYTLLAFAFQFLIGLFSDRFPRAPLLPAGLLLILLGFVPLNSLRLLTIGLGNAFFHTYAGRTILKSYTFKENGLFHGAGGLGLAAGSLAGYQQASLGLPLVMLLLMLGLELFLYGKGREKEIPGPGKLQAADRFELIDPGGSYWLTAVLLLFMAAVMAEFSLGRARPQIAPGYTLSLLPGALVWLFKILGSYIFERFYSPRRLALLLFAVMAAGLVFSGTAWTWIPYMLLISVNLYPLYALKYLLAGREGLAFGLNKLGLACAFVLSLMPASFASTGVGLLALFVLSLLLILLLKRKENC